MTDAREESAQQLSDYRKALDQTFEEHAADARKSAEQQIEAETEKLERETNKRLAIGQLDVRRRVSRRQEELKDKLFVELRDRIANFMETPEYTALLERQIAAARELAGEEELLIYMDPSDEALVGRLALHQRVRIQISAYSFSGGTRAVIPSRHILIDNSFETKLAEARQAFKFELGGGK